MYEAKMDNLQMKFWSAFCNQQFYVERSLKTPNIFFLLFHIFLYFLQGPASISCIEETHMSDVKLDASLFGGGLLDILLDMQCIYCKWYFLKFIIK